ncbi:MAG: hypothetical protein NVSMB46_01390 [Candidatus Saccharimonadales bacterium]
MLDEHTVAENAELERERLTSLINSMADGVIAIDKNTSVVLYNGAALNILDVNSTMSGKSLSDIIKLVDKNNQVIDLPQLITETKVQTTSRDWKLTFPDGSMINVYMSIAPVRLGYGQGGMSGYVLLLRDITREKSLEEERDEFIIEKNSDIQQVKDALHQAHDQINFLSGMINDLATLSRAERGKLNVDIEDINAHELIEEVIKTYKPDASKKNLSLNNEIDPNLELLKSSKLYVKEIIQNFVTNAIKYTQTGTVTVGATAKENGTDFFVRDTGIGISKTDQEKVFDKFFRSEDFRTRQSNGTGLGLYVTMKLARLIHAEIDLKSEINVGSTFTIFVPNLN